MARKKNRSTTSKGWQVCHGPDKIVVSRKLPLQMGDLDKFLAGPDIELVVKSVKRIHPDGHAELLYPKKPAGKLA